MIGFAVLVVVSLPLDRFSVLADENLSIESLFENDGGELGARVRVESNGKSGSLHAPSVQLSPRARAGDIFTNAFTAHPRASFGSVLAFDGLPESPVIAASAASTEDVRVSFLRTRRLAPGAYRNLIIGIAARVELAAGDYTFASVSMSLGSQLVAVGAAHVTSVGAFDGPLIGRVSGAHARDLIFVLRGNVSLGVAAAYRALLHAPGREVSVSALTSVRGAIVARSINLRALGSVTFEEGFAVASDCVGISCDDNSECTTDVCSNGACSHLPRTGAPCSDGNACTSADSCSASGVCTPGNPPVLSSSLCAVESCDPLRGVISTPKPAGTSCADSNLCNGAETCNGAGSCLAGTPLPTQSSACATETCDPLLGVISTPLPPGTSCADSNLCNGAETCDGAGSCSSGTPLPTQSSACATETCDPVLGVITTPRPAGTSCADADACNGQESCDGLGACRSGVPPILSDNNPCSEDLCDPAVGVIHLPMSLGSPCPDALSCNGEEACDGAGACLPGIAVDVRDTNPCTDGSCVEGVGVVQTPRPPGASCANASLCDGDETCNATGTCIPGVPPNEDDLNPCSADSCDPLTGVTHTPLAAGTSCDDGDVCNGIATCSSAGTCQPGVPPPVDDGNSCSIDRCDPVLGPTYTPIPNCLPDPALVAPPLDRTRETPFDERISFLWTGTPPIQTNADPATFDITRVSVVRGRVLDASLAPLQGARIRIAHHAEFGETFSRQDGLFDIAFNGGGRVTVTFDREGSLHSERDVDSHWNEATTLPDVVLIAADPVVTPVSFGAPVYQLVSGSLISDGDGTRTASALIAPETQASAVLADGSRVPLDSGSMRITEYTVGSVGGRAMPAPLPANVGYTYCLEMQLDEAVALDAQTVEFDRPVSVFYDNFVGAPVGSGVPMSSYDRGSNRWVGSPDGFVLKLLSKSPVSIDATGDSAADPELLALIGLDTIEADRIATRFAVGDTFIRAQVSHFSPLDPNWLIIIDPEPIDVPNHPPATPPATPYSCEKKDSRIECQNQFLGQRIPLQGVPSDLYYASDRTAGFTDAYAIDIPVGPLVNAQSHLRVSVTVGGKYVVAQPRAPQSEFSERRSTRFVWDGLDVFGRKLQGTHPATVRISYQPPFRYVMGTALIARSEAAGSGGGGVGARAPQSIERPSFGIFISEAVQDIVRRTPARFVDGAEMSLDQVYTVPLGTWDVGSDQLGQWQLGIHHHFDPKGQTLYLGTGRRVQTSAMGPVVNNIWIRNDGDAVNRVPSPLYSTVLADGSIYFAGFLGTAIAKTDRNGTSVVAGNPVQSGNLDGFAREARFGGIGGLTSDDAGNIYIADSSNGTIRMMTPQLNVVTLFGGGPRPPDGKPLQGTDARTSFLGRPSGIGRYSDGGFIFYDQNSRLLWEIQETERERIPTLLEFSARSGTFGQDGDRRQVAFDLVYDLAVTPQREVLLAEAWNGFQTLIRKIDATGATTTLAGGGSLPPTDGMLGTQVRLNAFNVSAPRLSGDGSVHFRASGGTLMRVLLDGTLRTDFGSNPGASSSTPVNEGIPAVQANVIVNGVNLAPDGSVLALTENSIARINALDKWSRGAANLVPSEDGTLVFVFDDYGRHIDTKDALTNVTLYHFAYQDEGLLSQITDRNGLRTTIERRGNGDASAIVGPYGERTELSIDSSGDLRTTTSPAAEAFALDYTNHLLTRMQSPRNGVSQYTYDAQGRLQRDKNAGRGGWTLTRDVNRNEGSYTVTATSDAGKATTYGVSSNTLSTERTHTTALPDGTHSTVVFKNAETRIETADGVITTSVDAADPRFGIRSPTQSITETMPSGLGSTASTTRSVTLTNPSDLSSISQWRETTQFGGRSAQTLYSRTSNTITSQSFLGRESTVLLDSLGRPRELRRPSFNNLLISYDAQGRVSQLDQGPRQSRLFYDAFGRLEHATDPLSRTTRWTRDAAGRVTSIERNDGRTIGFTRDAHGNVTSITPPGKPAHAISYSLNDVEESETPPSVSGGGINGGATLFDYNADDELTAVQRPDGVTTRLNRDTAGRVRSVSDSAGTRTFDYNATTGQLTSASDPSGQALTFTFDGSLPTGSVYTGAVAGSVTKTYDTRFMPSSISVNGSAVAYTIDTDGFVTAAGPLLANWRTSNGLLTDVGLGQSSTSYDYNGFGETNFQNNLQAGARIYREDYTRDALGRITFRTVSDSTGTHVFEYRYDAIGRLRQVYADTLLVEEYAYDDNGNRISATVRAQSRSGTYDNQDRLLALGDTSFAYNAAGELHTKTTPAGSTFFTYDTLGNLRRASLPTGRAVSYLIDPFNRRVGRQVRDADDTVIGQSGYLYDGQLRIVAELDASNNVVSRFVYATRLTTPDYMVRGGVTYRIITDHVGSPVLVLNSASGAVAQRMRYDSFGVVIEDTNPGFQPFGFAGGFYDRDTGLVRFGARDYDPETGRWTTKDPIRFAGGDTNLYGYVVNDPVNLVDPNGLWGVGVNAGGTAEVGVVVGAAAQANSGVGIFGGGPEGTNVGGYTASGGFAGSPDSESFAIGTTAGLGAGLWGTNATAAEQLLGPFDTWTVNLPWLSLQYATDGTVFTTSISLGKSWGWSVSRYKVTTTSASTWFGKKEPDGICP